MQSVHCGVSSLLHSDLLKSFTICSEIEITVKGNTGHALYFVENTAAEKSRKIIDSFLDLREREKAKLGENVAVTLGNVTTVNMTMIQVLHFNHHCNVNNGVILYRAVCNPT